MRHPRRLPARRFASLAALLLLLAVLAPARAGAFPSSHPAEPVVRAEPADPPDIPAACQPDASGANCDTHGIPVVVYLALAGAIVVGFVLKSSK
jgi:hypothetical protein